jgi:hypothetical protein
VSSSDKLLAISITRFLKYYTEKFWRSLHFVVKSRDILSALHDTYRRLAEAISDFPEALLEFIMAVYIWLSEAAIAICN